MTHLKEDEWPSNDDLTTEEQQRRRHVPAEQSPTPRHSQIKGDGIDTQDTQPNNGVPDAPSR